MGHPPTGPSTSPSPQTRFDESFCALLPRLYRRAVMLAGSRSWAEDAVHEAYLKLAARPQRFLDHPEPYAYAFTAVLNVVRDTHRRERRQVLVDDVDLPGAAGGADRGRQGAVGPVVAAAWDGGVERSDAEMEAVRLLRRLSSRQAGVVVLVDLDGYTIDQAARILKVHRGTAARHRARALEKLRSLLSGTQGERADGSGKEPGHEA
ncbi:RNA polymerase sigma factor [Streptomyces sp. TRM68367]|uniref:RNA polymerase sigma factor n=1 Tax=Streptomyces sp. TRM68367 TaxID=2758415 RepID=UPI00165C98B0|nr:RNA polymerase sigma factor [Streptomyces sp. TRM68367]MBC9728202.1 RNA polymerase sigma factor [Streptomyces sp. TRM68367]